MIERFKRSWLLTKQSFAILRQNKSLMVFPILSATATLAVIASFFVPVVAFGAYRHMGDPGYSLFVSLSILMPLSWLLAAIGVRQWSKRSWLFSWIFVLVPSILIYGCWAWFALR